MAAKKSECHFSKSCLLTVKIRNGVVLLFEYIDDYDTTVQGLTEYFTYSSMYSRQAYTYVAI